MLLFVVTKYFIDNEVTNCITGVNIDSFLSDTPGTALCVKTLYSVNDGISWFRHSGFMCFTL